MSTNLTVARSRSVRFGHSKCLYQALWVMAAMLALGACSRKRVHNIFVKVRKRTVLSGDVESSSNWLQLN